MKIPNKIKIGAHIYDIVFRDDLDDEDFGTSRQKKLKIFINQEIPQTLQEETLFHEVIHNIYLQNGLSIGINETEEEKQVQIISHGIYQFLKDNNLLK